MHFKTYLILICLGKGFRHLETTCQTISVVLLKTKLSKPSSHRIDLEKYVSTQPNIFAYNVLSTTCNRSLGYDIHDTPKRPTSGCLVAAWAVQ